MAGLFPPATSGTAALNNILVQEANRIGPDLYRDTLHQSPWTDLIKKGTFPDGMGYQLQTLIYERALPVNDGNDTATFDQAGLNWSSVAATALATDNSAIASGIIAGSADDRVGPNHGLARVDFTKRMKAYNLQRAPIVSPRINIDDLRFAAYRTEQLGAIMQILKEVTQRSWEDRYRSEYERVCANLVPCLAAATPIVTYTDVSAGTTFEGLQITDVDFENDLVTSGSVVDYTPAANISNAIMDKIYMRMVRSGAGINAYGRENARPVFGLVLSSEASRQLLVEANYRDDIRYNNSKVSALVEPLGVEKSFRGFYHLVDDLAPRFTLASTDGGATEKLVAVPPEKWSTSVGVGVIIDNPAYDSAPYEAMYVLHADVMEALIPNPVSGPGVSFNPVNYRGDFKWLNIPNETTNPDGTIGFFRGVLASASKPIQTRWGYVIIRKRTVTDLAV